MRPLKIPAFTLCLIFCLAVASPLHTRAQGISSVLADTLQTALNNIRVSYNVKGISAAVYIPGRGMWTGVTGVSYGSVPIESSMLLGIGSVTKTFVAAEIFKLIEAGSLSLDDTIGALLPPLSYANPSISVRQLLGHTSGMGDFTNASWESAMLSDPTATWYFPDVLNGFCSPAAAAPGSAWHYCNANYSLLGMIIEAKKSDSLHRVLRSDLLGPSHLYSTYMETFEPYMNPIPHNWATPTLSPALATDASATPHQALWSSVEPVGGYFAHPSDLATWAYDLYSGNVLSATSLAAMLTFTPVTGSYFTGYGLGAMKFSMGGQTYYGHAGNYFGYAASMLFHTSDSICVAVLINQDCIATYEAKDLIAALLKKLSTGVNDPIKDGAFTISPNPANTLLNINMLAANSNTHISITDIAGREVYQGKATGSKFTVNTECMDAGTYLVRILNNGEIRTEQVQIQH